VIVGAVALAATTVCVLIVQRLQRLALERQRSLEEQIAAVDEAVQMIEARLTELHSWWVASQPAESESEDPASSVAAPGQGEEPAIEPEIQAAIVAAAVAAAGPNARVRSAALVKSHDKASPWSQQGRVLVQSSHNLRQ
jgi:hypothetical protein